MIGKTIRELREELGVSQEELASKVNLPRPAVTQIESGSRKVSADELLAFSRILNVPMERLMGLQAAPHVSFVHEPSASYKADSLEMRISVPQRNLRKFRQVLLYVLNKVGAKPNIGEAVLYKLLYFIDFNFYEKYEDQLIGATYIKNHYGPTPVEFKKLVDQMIDKGEIERVKSSYFSFPQTKYLPLKSPDLAELSAREVEVIDQVLGRLSDMNAKQISDYSHEDVPWKTAENGAKIEYESVFYRTPNYSVRVYGEDL
jgi:transcriptional regulator with XRE-family HTH domain